MTSNIHAEIGQKFGIQASDYAKGRKASSQPLFDHIKQRIERQFPHMNIDQIATLDIGCGTGISTRGLYSIGLKNIFGLDSSREMLAEGQKFAGPSVPKENYMLGTVDEIKKVFHDRKFSVITAFSAFHWFCTDEAVKAIREALTSDGIFIVVNTGLGKSQSRNKNEYWKLIEQLQGSPVHDPRENFHPVEVLTGRGFTVEKHVFTRQSFYDFDTLLAMKRSFSGWCNLTEEQKIAGDEALRQLVHKQIASQGSPDNIYCEELEEQCIIAH